MESLYLLSFHLWGLFLFYCNYLSSLCRGENGRSFFRLVILKIHAFGRDQQWGNSISAGFVLQAAFVLCSAYSFFTVNIKWSHNIVCRTKDNSWIPELEYIKMACLIILNYLVHCIFFILKYNEIFGCVNQCPWSSFLLLPDLIL